MAADSSAHSASRRLQSRTGQGAVAGRTHLRMASSVPPPSNSLGQTRRRPSSVPAPGRLRHLPSNSRFRVLSVGSKSFLSDYRAFLRRLEVEWTTERDSEPYDTDDEKQILSRAMDDAVHFRSKITEDKSELS